jgi:hypothetical protein
MNIVCIGRPKVEYDRGVAVLVAAEGHEEQLVKRLCFADEVHIWDMRNEFWLGLVYFHAMLDARTRRQCRIRLMFRDTHIACGRVGKLFEELHERCLTCGGERRVRHWYAQDELGWKRCPDCVPPAAKTCALQGEAKPFVPPCGSGIGPCNECSGREKCRQMRAEHNER